MQNLATGETVPIAAFPALPVHIVDSLENVVNAAVDDDDAAVLAMSSPRSGLKSG